MNLTNIQLNIIFYTGTNQNQSNKYINVNDD